MSAHYTCDQGECTAQTDTLTHPWVELTLRVAGANGLVAHACGQEHLTHILAALALQQRKVDPGQVPQ